MVSEAKVLVVRKAADDPEAGHTFTVVDISAGGNRYPNFPADGRWW